MLGVSVCLSVSVFLRFCLSVCFSLSLFSLSKYTLGYDMGPKARPVILSVTAPRNRASEYLKFE